MSKRRMSVKPIRVGVIGLRRGMNFARGAGNMLGMELVAICDNWKEKLPGAKAALAKEGRKVATYTDYDKFLEHDMDAVVLANYFHQHAPFAIKALAAGKHVMSETAACFTLAEGVALIEAVEKSGKIYMFAENYPYMVFNQEMRKLFRQGVAGKFQYGEGEYVHPMSAEEHNRISPGINHWRSWIPCTYYCTHALAPIMFITDTMPVKVNAFPILHDPEDMQHFGQTMRRNDTASCIICRMDNGGIAKLLQYSLRGHGIWVRIHGTKALMENQRWGSTNMLRVRRESFDKDPGEPTERIYQPEFPEQAAEAARSGHGGGDFFMNYHFADAIRTGKQPYWNVHRGVAASIVGIQAYRSALKDSGTFEIPDFHLKQKRDEYRNDDWNPDPSRHKEGYPWPSVLGKVTPSPKAVAFAKSVWKKTGYTGYNDK